jgi:spermidine/putrescine transport system substrate-binding protein
MKRLLTFPLLFCDATSFGCVAPQVVTSPPCSYISSRVRIAHLEKKRTNVKIQYDTFENSDALYAKLKQGKPWL